MRRNIKVFEFEKLTIKPDEFGRSLSKTELNKLYEFNDCNRNIYFVPIRDGVKFCNYVGVIQIGKLTIEILPKTDQHKSTESDLQQWHQALMDMLRVCKLVSISSVSEADLKKKYNSILDLYFEMYISEVEKIYHKGLIKKYRTVSGNLNSFKGRIDFNKQIQQNLIHQERVFSKHQTFDYDNLMNQILWYGIKVLKQLTFDTNLIQRIRKLELVFPEVKSMPITANHFEIIHLNRKNVIYQKALEIAKIIILNYSPDISVGNDNMLTILFDMNKLWEEYIYRLLKRVKREDIEVSRQAKDKFWENRIIKPDLLIIHTIGDKTFNYIIDTKWKIIRSNKPADNDLKQMYTYNIYFNAYKSLLLYPATKLVNESFGNFWKGRENPELNQCKVGFINVLSENGKLDYAIGEKILEKLITKEK